MLKQLSGCMLQHNFSMSEFISCTWCMCTSQESELQVVGWDVLVPDPVLLLLTGLHLA